MKLKRQFGRLGMLAAVLALGAGIVGCERTKISDINKNPGRYSGYDVTIAGEVTSDATQAQLGAFQLDDGSGKLWVLSGENPIPAQGAHIAVTGLVESGVNLGSTSLPVTLQETRRYEGGD